MRCCIFGKKEERMIDIEKIKTEEDFRELLRKKHLLTEGDYVIAILLFEILKELRNRKIEID